MPLTRWADPDGCLRLGESGLQVGVVFAFDDLEPVLACTGGVVGHVDVRKNIATCILKIEAGSAAADD